MIRMPAGVDEAGDEIDRAEFLQQRGVECDFVQTVHDVVRGLGNVLALDRIDLHEDHVAHVGLGEEGKQRGIPHIAAVPIIMVVDLHGPEDGRQAGRGHQHVDG